MEEEEKVKESLMINPLAYPEEKFTEDGKSYYYTRGDGTPITNESWSLKDLSYPLNVPFGGKRQGNLSDWTFTNWLVNAAPGQLAPIGAAVKGIKTMRNQHRTSPHGFYKEDSVDVKPKTYFNKEKLLTDIIDKRMPRLTQGEGLYDPKVYIPPNELIGTQKGDPLQMSQEPKVSTNEHIKRALLNDQNIILSPTYKGGQITRRDHADFFDVSAALIGGGQEDARDPSGRKIDYNRAKVTEFGGTKSEKRDLVYNHINSKIKGGISREEFNEYAKEQIEAEKDLRKAIKLLNVRAYASMKGIDLSEYPTKESQLELLSEINKAKKNKTGHLDYKETFDYGHIISAKTGFRLEDLGMNRISNTEIEAAHNIVSRDPYTQKIIEILQEGNRERGSRRDYHPTIQRMRNTAGSVVEDFIKWKANKGDDSVNLTKILEKFIPKDQHENYLQFIQKRFYEKRALGYATKKEFVEEVYGFPYKLYKDMPNKQKHEIDKAYVKQRSESGIVAGKQQYDQAGEWMLEAIDEFIGLHHFDKAKQLHNTKESTQLQDIHDFHTDTGAPLTIEDLLDMILPD
jgi:hypothetical protein